MVVDGLTIAVEALTDVEVALEVGATVEIKGVISGADLVASKIEGFEDDGADAPDVDGEED